MEIELTERPVDEFRHLKSGRKTRFWREHKTAIIAQGLTDEKRTRERDEYLNREEN